MRDRWKSFLRQRMWAYHLDRDKIAYNQWTLSKSFHCQTFMDSTFPMPLLCDPLLHLSQLSITEAPKLDREVVANLQMEMQLYKAAGKLLVCKINSSAADLREAAGLLFHVHLLLSESEKCNPFTNGGWLLVRGLVPVWFCFAFKFHQPTYCKKAYVIWNESTRSCCLNEKMTYLSK